MEFSYFMPVRLIFGSNVVDQLGATAKNYGKHALIVTGRGSTKRSGLLDRAIALLEKEGVQATVFNKVEPNPLTTTVMEGAALAREKGCDLVIGMGGGSMMDAAKAVAFCAVNDGDVSDYISGSKQGTGCLPILEVPTTCGTGSEANPFAVLTNPETKDKKSLWGDLIYPKVSFIDPELMKTMPKACWRRWASTLGPTTWRAIWPPAASRSPTSWRCMPSASPPRACPWSTGARAPRRTGRTSPWPACWAASSSTPPAWAAATAWSTRSAHV